MLKITTHADAGRITLELEGRVAGPWVEELKACWQRAAIGHRQVGVILKEVTFIDEAGRKLLADMCRQRVTLTGAGCMTKAIIEEIIRGENL
jgi:anti-anti-sigma regulatory factor